MSSPSISASCMITPIDPVRRPGVGDDPRRGRREVVAARRGDRSHGRDHGLALLADPPDGVVDLLGRRHHPARALDAHHDGAHEGSSPWSWQLAHDAVGVDDEALDLDERDPVRRRGMGHRARRRPAAPRTTTKQPAKTSAVTPSARTTPSCSWTRRCRPGSTRRRRRRTGRDRAPPAATADRRLLLFLEHRMSAARSRSDSPMRRSLGSIRMTLTVSSSPSCTTSCGRRHRSGRHLGDVEQAVDPRLELHERARTP